MIDHAFFSQDDNLDLVFGKLIIKNGTEIRRSRLFTSCTVYGNVDFKLYPSFEGGKVGLKDVYLGIK